MSRRGVLFLLVAAVFLSGVGLFALISVSVRDESQIRVARTNLLAVVKLAGSDIAPGDSLRNLLHYLSKDPGRQNFAGNADRRRMKAYLDTARRLYGDDMAAYEKRLETEGVLEGQPDWLGRYLVDVYGLYLAAVGDVSSAAVPTPELTMRLLEEVMKDDGAELPLAVQALPGMARALTGGGQTDVHTRLERAVSDFAAVYFSYSRVGLDEDPDRFRKKILDDRRLNRLLDTYDQAWLQLINELYNLSRDSGWRYAVSHDPEIHRGWSEMTTMVVGADLFRRTRDILANVEETPRSSSISTTEGVGAIRRVPNLAYYKNIPELTGQTADGNTEGGVTTYFTAKVHLGYQMGDKKTQTFLNQNKDALADSFRAFFSRKRSDDFVLTPGVDADAFALRLALIKAVELHAINRRILVDNRFGSRDVSGVRDISLVKVNLVKYP